MDLNDGISVISGRATSLSCSWHRMDLKKQSPSPSTSWILMVRSAREVVGGKGRGVGLNKPIGISTTGVGTALGCVCLALLLSTLPPCGTPVRDEDGLGWAWC